MKFSKAEPHLWKRKGVWYAVYMDRGKQRKKSLGTGDKDVATPRLNQFIRLWKAGEITQFNQGKNIDLDTFRDALLDY